MSKGKIICLDGIDSCGKTTLIKGVKERLESKNIPVASVPMIGGGTAGPIMRNLLMTSGKEPWFTKESEAALVHSINVDTYFNTVKTLVENGTNVLLDRFATSYFVYQVVSNANKDSIAAELFYNFLETMSDNLLPGLLIKLSIDPQLAISRQRGRTDNNYLDSFAIDEVTKRQNNFTKAFNIVCSYIGGMTGQDVLFELDITENQSVEELVTILEDRVMATINSSD